MSSSADDFLLPVMNHTSHCHPCETAAVPTEITAQRAESAYKEVSAFGGCAAQR